MVPKEPTAVPFRHTGEALHKKTIAEDEEKAQIAAYYLHHEWQEDERLEEVNGKPM